jgi:aspartyl-tRNA(Asn)/glutamyl-tRNA(Gln) amidotransferase subunit A
MENVFKNSFFLNDDKESLIKKYEENINKKNYIINSFVHFDKDLLLEDKNNKILDNKQIKLYSKINLISKFNDYLNQNLNENEIYKKDKNKQSLQNNNIDNESVKSNVLKIKFLKCFQGVPVGIKDNICYTKLETTCGSSILKGYIPSYNADVVNLLNEYGAIVIGNTNMDEFAMGSTTETSCYGETKNPLNYEIIPGGSSGGSAAAVASDMVPIALGSDTGGSVRQPASLCGVYGFKPTWGAISRYGLIAFASSLDQIGIFSKSAFDVFFTFLLLSDESKFDMTKINFEERERYFNLLNYCSDLKEFYFKWIETIKKPKKIAIFKNIEKYISCKYTKTLYHDFINILKDKFKIEIEEIEIEYDFKDILSVYYIIAPAEASSNLARYDSLRYGKKREEGNDLFEIISKTRFSFFNDEVKRRINIGNFVLSVGYKDKYYRKALSLRNLVKEKIEEIFYSYDYILLPSTPSYLKKIGEKMNPIDIYASDIFTVIANIVDSPAISIPFGVNLENNTGIGMQFIAPKKKDFNLLEFVNLIERNVF